MAATLGHNLALVTLSEIDALEGRLLAGEVRRDPTGRERPLLPEKIYCDTPTLIAAYVTGALQAFKAGVRVYVSEHTHRELQGALGALQTAPGVGRPIIHLYEGTPLAATTQRQALWLSVIEGILTLIDAEDLVVVNGDDYENEYGHIGSECDKDPLSELVLCHPGGQTAGVCLTIPDMLSALYQNNKILLEEMTIVNVKLALIGYRYSHVSAEIVSRACQLENGHGGLCVHMVITQIYEGKWHVDSSLNGIFMILLYAFRNASYTPTQACEWIAAALNGRSFKKVKWKVLRKLRTLAYERYKQGEPYDLLNAVAEIHGLVSQSATLPPPEVSGILGHHAFDY